MKNVFNTGVAIAGAIGSYLFGGWSALLGILLAFVVTDYITGVMSAGMNGKLSSKIGMKGIAKKVFIFIIVAVAHLVDEATGAGHMFRDATVFFYLANEVISILENAGTMGVPIPGILQKAIDILNSKGEGTEL